MDNVKDVNYWLSEGQDFYDAKNYEEAIKCYKEAIKLDLENSAALNNWANALCELAKINNDESLLKNIKIFEDVSEYLDIDDRDTFLIKGKLYFILKKEREAIENFEESEILEILNFLDKEKYRKRLKIKILYPLLESACNDSYFFKEAEKNLKPEDKKEYLDNLDKYKEAYILSVFIISQLHVKNENEKSIAHYTKENIAKKMLIENKETNENSRFRLNAINYSNDPKEGITLLNYLFGKDSPKREDLNTEYGAFAGCFTFNYDSLNQFRLYGKKDDKEEGTGLSIVFQNNFFSKEAKMANPFGIYSLLAALFGTNEDKNIPLPLFRCIYIDPETGLVESVGYKERLLFYKEGKDKKEKEEDKEIEKKFKEYNNYINGILKSVKNNMEKLKNVVKDLNPIIVGRLLINLRYLTKHIAFKEEQECRILEIHRFDDTNKVKVETEKSRMYIEYLDIKKGNNGKNYIEKIYFGPKATDMELFKDFLKRKGLNIHCEKSKNPLA